MSRRRNVFNIDLVFSKRMKSNLQQALPFWIAALIVGLVAVGYTSLFNLAESLLQDVVRWKSWTIFIMSPLCFLLAWMMVQSFAPNARGSGIPQVMASLELSGPRHQGKIDELLSFRVIIIKITSSLMMALGGGAIGREGPTIQVAGSVFRVVNKLIPSSWPRLSDQSYILTGASAGLAAAFNTPLGGIVFAIEELAKVHIRYFRTALFSGVLIAGLTAQALLGPYLYLGYPDVRGLEFAIFLGVGATSIVAGILGACMSRLILALMKWRATLVGWRSVLFVIATGICVASLAYFVSESIIGSGKGIMNGVLFSDNKSVSWDTALLRMTGPVFAFNTGAAGGVFAPSLSAGASVGAFISGIFDIQGANANILILGGMVGFLTGVTRTPFTSAILVLEMTDRHSVIFHLILSAMISNVAALLIDRHSLYEHLKRNYLKSAVDETKQ